VPVIAHTRRHSKTPAPSKAGRTRRLKPGEWWQKRTPVFSAKDGSTESGGGEQSARAWLENARVVTSPSGQAQSGRKNKTVITEEDLVPEMRSSRSSCVTCGRNSSHCRRIRQTQCSALAFVNVPGAIDEVRPNSLPIDNQVLGHLNARHFLAMRFMIPNAP
jgi:hypothetical protein